MKTISITKPTRLAGLIMAVLFAGAIGVRAEGAVSGKGGATLLMKPMPPVSTPSDNIPMTCGKCKDEHVIKRTPLGKGAFLKTESFTKHLCSGCDTTIGVAGHGKAKQDVVTHKCTACGAENLTCCNMKAGSEAATKGMKQN